MAASLLLRLMWCHDFDPSIMLPSADVVTLIAIADIATLFILCRDSDMMSLPSSANVATLDF